MKWFTILLFASAASVPAAPALAQEGEQGAQETSPGESAAVTGARRRDEIVVASGVGEYAEQIGRAVTLLTRTDIEESQALALSDLLRRVPGVSVSRNGGIGSFTGVRIRGAEAEQTLVLIDGVRVNDPSSPSGTFDFGNLLTGAIQRVEVLRGPGSVMWGGQAIGGVVNVVTEQAEWGTRARGNAEYGAFDTVSANAALIAANERLNGTLTAGYFRTGGISAAASGSEADGYRQFGVTARGGVNFSDNVSLDLRSYFADSRVEQDGFPPPNYTLADTLEYADGRELYGYAGLRVKLFDSAFDNRFAVTLADIHRDNFDPAAGAVPVFFGRGSSERYGWQGDYNSYDWFRGVIGLEHEDSRFDDGASPASTGITSGYAQAIVTPIDDLTLNAGARYDDHRDFGGHTSLAFSAAYKPGYYTVLRAAYGEGFKAPTLYQLNSFFGDPFLQPETARSYEAGFEQRVEALNLQLAATVFRRDTVNQIDFDLGTFTYGNIARTRATGIETSASASFGALRVEASYTHLKAENRSPGANLGNDLARRPRDFGSLSADYRFDSGDGPSIGATLFVAGRSFDDAGNFTRLGGYVLVGIRGEVPLGERFAIYGRVENLFDEQYQTVAGYGTPGRAAYAGLRVRLD